jgi:hypothetical protein
MKPIGLMSTILCLCMLAEAQSQAENDQSSHR